MRRRKHNLGTRESRAERHYRAALGEIAESGVLDDVRRVLKARLTEAFLSALDEADEEYGEAAELRDGLAAFFGVDCRTSADALLNMVRKLHADASGHEPQQDERDDKERLAWRMLREKSAAFDEIRKTIMRPEEEWTIPAMLAKVASLAGNYNRNFGELEESLDDASTWRAALAELVDLDEDCTVDDLLSAVRQRLQALAEAAALVGQIEETLSATSGHVLERAKVYARDRAAFEKVGALIFGEGADWSREQLIGRVAAMVGSTESLMTALRRDLEGSNEALAVELGRVLGIPDEKQTHDEVVRLVRAIEARNRSLEERFARAPNAAEAREQC